MEIARANSKKNSSAAGIAFAKAQELLPKIPLSEQMPTITEMASLYGRIGDKESAEKMIELGTKTASEVFKKETDADDPNLAPKAYWVSTNAWRNLVDDSYKLDPGQAMTLLKEAPDDRGQSICANLVGQAVTREHKSSARLQHDCEQERHDHDDDDAERW